MSGDFNGDLFKTEKSTSVFPNKPDCLQRAINKPQYKLNSQFCVFFAEIMFPILMLLLYAFLATALSTNSAHVTHPKNCKEIQDQGVNITGIHLIKPDASEESFFVYCDMETKGGGWLYFLQRMSGLESFAVPWSDYKIGFGNLVKEFWLGLEHLHQLTGKNVNELLIELVDWDLKKYHIHYKAFSIASEEQGYRLQILGGHSGDLEDSLSWQAGRKFTTKDRDNDKNPGLCADIYGGAWWYNDCHTAHLTGVYSPKVNDDPKGITWDGFRKVKPDFKYYNFKEARMMIRPHSQSFVNI